MPTQLLQPHLKDTYGLAPKEPVRFAARPDVELVGVDVSATRVPDAIEAAVQEARAQPSDKGLKFMQSVFAELVGDLTAVLGTKAMTAIIGQHNYDKLNVAIGKMMGFGADNEVQRARIHQVDPLLQFNCVLLGSLAGNIGIAQNLLMDKDETKGWIKVAAKLGVGLPIVTLITAAKMSYLPGTRETAEMLDKYEQHGFETREAAEKTVKHYLDSHLVQGMANAFEDRVGRPLGAGVQGLLDGSAALARRFTGRGASPAEAAAAVEAVGDAAKASGHDLADGFGKFARSWGPTIFLYDTFGSVLNKEAQRWLVKNFDPAKYVDLYPVEAQREAEELLIRGQKAEYVSIREQIDGGIRWLAGKFGMGGKKEPEYDTAIASAVPVSANHGTAQGAAAGI